MCLLGCGLELLSTPARAAGARGLDKAQQGWIPRNLPEGSLVGQPGGKGHRSRRGDMGPREGLFSSSSFRMPDPKTCMYVHIHDLTEEYCVWQNFFFLKRSSLCPPFVGGPYIIS